MGLVRGQRRKISGRVRAWAKKRFERSEEKKMPKVKGSKL